MYWFEIISKVLKMSPNITFWRSGLPVPLWKRNIFGHWLVNFVDIYVDEASMYTAIAQC